MSTAAWRRRRPTKKWDSKATDVAQSEDLTTQKRLLVKDHGHDPMSGQYELYRRCQLGITLTDTLDELIQDGHIDPQMAMKILTQFDHSMADFLHNSVKARVVIRGHLHIYRFCDDVWTFVIDKPEFRMDNSSTPISADKAKVVACAAKPSATAASTAATAPQPS